MAKKKKKNSKYSKIGLILIADIKLLPKKRLLLEIKTFYNVEKVIRKTLCLITKLQNT